MTALELDAEIQNLTKEVAVCTQNLFQVQGALKFAEYLKKKLEKEEKKSPDAASNSA